MAGVVARWRALRANQRFLAGLLALAAVAALAFALLLQRDTRVPLFAQPLHGEQLAEVVERLAEWNVAFVTLPDNVRVAANRKNDLLLRLSLAGIPHAHLATSAEVLQQAGPLTPQSVLDAQQRQGLADDLAASLRGIGGVEEARVIIAPAQAGSFADETSYAATASVRLSLLPGATLSKASVEGVRTFVAAGVPGLDPKRVTILDDRGVALGDPAAAPASNEAQLLQASLQSALDLALGAAATIVRVHVDYDPQLHEMRDVVRRSLGGHAIGSTTSAETYHSASKTYAKRNAALDGGSELHDEHVETPAGRLERISVAVAVDASRRFDLRKIRALASATLGLLPGRGDVVSVEAVAFPHAAPQHSAPMLPLVGLIAALGPSAFLAIALVVGVRSGAQPACALLTTLVQRLTVPRSTRLVAAFPAAHVRGALAGEPPHTAAAIISALPAATATAVLELYPPEERAAIVRRMSRAASPVVPDYESVLRRV
ncbi:MAG: hypothetical protein M3R44_06225 [Candidatus Eremiobacteraeota bacterium]|nr:hypothetical protein [Candidatus Eremiobacteraeota bacterium]